MNTEIQQSLKQVGLSDKEIITYLASLALGESTIVPIARRLRLPRTTVQYILEKLAEQGLIEILPKSGRKTYLPYPPRQVLTLLKHKQEKLREQVESFESLLPELARIFSTSPFHPKVRFFEGHELRKIYEEILEAPIDETLFIGAMNQVAEAVGEQYLKKWMKRRAEKQIKTRAVRVRSGEVEDAIYNASEGFLRSVRLAPEGFSSPSHIIIYGENVASLTTGKENFGVVTTSRDYAITMRHCFDEVWKNSKPYITASTK